MPLVCVYLVGCLMVSEMAKHIRKAELNIDPRDLRDLFVAASYYLGLAQGAELTKGQFREVVRVKGAFDEWVDEINGQIERGEV